MGMGLELERYHLFEKKKKKRRGGGLGFQREWCVRLVLRSP